MLELASVLTFLIGLAHSVLGERYILIRLFKRKNLPQLLGGDFFTKGTLRFAWHLTTIAWWGLALVLFLMARDTNALRTSMLYIISVVFLLSGIISAGFTKGKHLSWIIFFVIAGLCIFIAFSH